MKYKVTVEVLNVKYQREYDSDAGPTEILKRDTVHGPYFL
jgi:hypothetical protein